MTNETPRRRDLYDLDALRAAVGIPEVLASAGIDTAPRSKRIRCPIHRGDNASAFSFDRERFRCFVCDAHGDVFELARVLHSLRFPEAVEHVARIAGVAATATPRATQQQIQQRVTISRRRATLLAFREGRLNALAVELYELDRAADVAGAALTVARDTDDEDEGWAVLEAVHRARDEAEHERTVLEVDSEASWLDVFAATRGAKCAA